MKTITFLWHQFIAGWRDYWQFLKREAQSDAALANKENAE